MWDRVLSPGLTSSCLPHTRAVGYKCLAIRAYEILAKKEVGEGKACLGLFFFSSQFKAFSGI